MLAELAQSVVAVECDATLAAKAATLLNGRAKLVVGPLELGSKENGPYDAILLNGAVDGVPAGLIDQMAVGGVMVGVKQEGSIGRAFVGRKSATGFGIDPFMDVMVPLLLGFAKPRGFVF